MKQIKETGLLSLPQPAPKRLTGFQYFFFNKILLLEVEIAEYAGARKTRSSCDFENSSDTRFTDLLPTHNHLRSLNQMLSQFEFESAYKQLSAIATTITVFFYMAPK